MNTSKPVVDHDPQTLSLLKAKVVIKFKGSTGPSSESTYSDFYNGNADAAMLGAVQEIAGLLAIVGKGDEVIEAVKAQVAAVKKWKEEKK